ncbi:transposase [Natroniella acetigena]|uniref:transposase n=1 Tax=Natroniella acetigena TaxID=52004 RepID=UPI003D1569DA
MMLKVSLIISPKGYRNQIEAIFHAFLAQQIEQIPSRVKLIKRLKTDLKFRYICGFNIFGSIPSEATFSRYFLKFMKQIL